jgi:hypothetical protein
MACVCSSRSCARAREAESGQGGKGASAAGEAAAWKENALRACHRHVPSAAARARADLVDDGLGAPPLVVCARLGHLRGHALLNGAV